MSDLSMLVFCFRGHTFVVYLRTTKFHNNSVFKDSLYTFYSRKPTCGIPPCLRISHRKYPLCPQNSIIVNPRSPSEILKAVRGMVWIFSGIAHWARGWVGRKKRGIKGNVPNTFGNDCSCGTG